MKVGKAYGLYKKICWYTIEYRSKPPFSVEKLYGHIWYWVWLGLFLQSLMFIAAFTQDSEMHIFEDLIQRLSTSFLFGLCSWIFYSVVEKHRNKKDET